MNRRRDWTTPGVLVALVALLAAGTVLPAWLVFLLQVAIASALAVLGVMIQFRSGLVSFGQGLYYCLGGYSAGLAGYFLGITDAFVVLALGIVVCLVVAGVLGFLMRRYREIFYAMLSLAFSMILYGVLVNAAVLGSTDGFNVPHASYLGFVPAGRLARYTSFALSCVVAAGAVLLVHRYLSSTLGFVGDAVRENELRVEYLGASVHRAVHLQYLLAAAITGSGGVLFALANGHVDPEMTYWTTSGEFVFVALLSGVGHVAAPFVGALLLELVRVYAVEYSPYTWQMILGATMLLIILWLPGGIWSLLTGRRREGRQA